METEAACRGSAPTTPRPRAPLADDAHSLEAPGTSGASSLATGTSSVLDAVVSPDYWLAHCEGYRVDADVGRIGFVEEVLGDSSHRVLAVRAGSLGRRVILVSVDEVAYVVPRAQRIWLRTVPTS
jgi:hypothetical protein